MSATARRVENGMLLSIEGVSKEYHVRGKKVLALDSIDGRVGRHFNPCAGRCVVQRGDQSGGSLSSALAAKGREKSPR
jgi:hypothetical protein